MGRLERPRRRVKAGCDGCKYGQHSAHFVQTWLDRPAWGRAVKALEEG